MAYYSAESVIAALKANGELSCDGIESVGCPSAHDGCKGDPVNCDLCNNRKCKQPVSVHRNYQKLAVLVFKFMLRNSIGFIHQTDSVLMRLLQRNMIDKSKLKVV